MDMPQCAVINCNNTHRKTKGGSVRYHRFPGDAETRARWIQSCGRHVQNCATARICSRHFSDFNYERDVQHELLGLPTRCRLKKGSIPNKNLPPELQEEHPPVDNAIAVLLAVGLIPIHISGRKCGGLPEDLNKMHVMEDVHEGCDTQPSSPGHADQRPELEVESKVQNGTAFHKDVLKEDSETVESKSNGKLNVVDENVLSEIQENGSNAEEIPNTATYKKESEDDKTIEDSASNDSSCNSNKRKQDSNDSTPKKFKSDIEECFNVRDKVINEYISNINCNSVEQIQLQTEQLLAEIRTLNELAREKEREWNNIIHLKKIKEELLLRIQRQKQILLITSGNSYDNETASYAENSDEKLQSRKQSILKNKVLGLSKTDLSRQRQVLPKTLQSSSFDLNSQVNDYRQIRQRNIVDVQSIIADYRQRHPEIVPRRGRRIRTVLNANRDGANTKISNSGILNFSNIALGSGAQVKQNLSSAGLDINSELGILLSSLENGSRHSEFTDVNPTSAQDITSFKDMLVQFAKLSQNERQELIQNKSKLPPPPYPEVTVHPVTTGSPHQPTSSLLHGILTKAQAKNESKTTFSPTLARLLTAPERAASISHGSSSTGSFLHTSNVSISEILSSSKTRNEITITPVGGQFDASPNRQSGTHADEEEAEDSADRLVIDESEMLEGRSKNNDSSNMHDNNSDNDEVPQCQGCHQKSAQFVCAGCGNQWYCSRECQVSAWDEHSEVCSG